MLIEDRIPDVKNLIELICASSRGEFGDRGVNVQARWRFDYFPQTLIMAIMTSYEKTIKGICDDIVIDYDSALGVNSQKFPVFYRELYKKKTNAARPDAVNVMYRNFRAHGQADASGFYELFNDPPFKNDLIASFNVEKAEQIVEHEDLMKGRLGNATRTDGGRGDKPEYDADDPGYVLPRIRDVSFDGSEGAFLNLKKYRDDVAHDFTANVLLPTDEICDLYYDSLLYFVSLEKELRRFDDGLIAGTT